MSKTISKFQLLSAKEENVQRLAQYLGIDITGLSKEEAANVIAIRLLFYTTIKNFEW